MDELRAKGLRWVEILKELSQSSEFRSFVRLYYESRVSDSLFDFQVKLSELRNNFGSFDEVLSLVLNEGDYNFVMENIGGINYNGRNLYPSLFVFYYHPEFKELVRAFFWWRLYRDMSAQRFPERSSL